MDNAITGNMAHLMAAMKVVKRFKSRMSERRGQFMDGILGRESRLTAPPHSMRHGYQSRSQDTHDRRPLDRILVTSGVNRNVEVNDAGEAVPPDMEHLTMVASPEGDDDADFVKRIDETEAHYKQRLETLTHQPSYGSRSATETRTGSELEESFKRRSRTFPVDGHLKGHAHDPLEDTLFLHIGHDPSGLQTNDDLDYPMVSESPPAVEMDIYEQAYQEEMERILERRGREPSIYMTRRVEHREDIRTSTYIKDAGRYAARQAAANFERFSNKAYERGRPMVESSKSYARSAGGKASESWTSGSAYAAPYLQSGKEYLEPWKQSAKSAASRAGEKIGAFYNKSGGPGESISGLVARAQAKARGDAAASSDESQQPASTATTEEVAQKANADFAATQAPETPEEPRKSSAEEIKPSSGSTPLGPPIGGSVFKEHI